MKKQLLAMIIACAVIGCVTISCKKDKTLELSKEIKNIVPDSTLNKITTLGMPINKGSNPANLQNIYKVSPFTLKATNITNDYDIGYVFSDYKFRLYDQDNDKLTIKLDYVNGTESGTGIGGFISGDGNNFSVFVKVHSVIGSSSAEALQIISGTISSEGIKNFYFSNFMLDDYGDPTGIWIEEETGRVFYDSDNISPVVLSLQDKALGNLVGISAGSSLKK